MYFVDGEKITKTLSFYDQQVTTFENQSNWAGPVYEAALERIVHTLIESILDVGNAMIDGFIMREAGSYEDIIDILLDEKVITADMSQALKELIDLRPELVQNYIKIDHEQFEKVVKDNLNLIKKFSPRVNAYLENELGPVSAFLPEK